MLQLLPRSACCVMQTRHVALSACGSCVGIQLSKINEGGEGLNAVYPSRGLLTRLPRRIRLSPSPVWIVSHRTHGASLFIHLYAPDDWRAALSSERFFAASIESCLKSALI